MAQPKADGQERGYENMTFQNKSQIIDIQTSLPTMTRCPTSPECVKEESCPDDFAFIQEVIVFGKT